MSPRSIARGRALRAFLGFASDPALTPVFELILQFRGRGVETEEELVEIEDALFELLAPGEALDGHEVTPGARNISVATADAPGAFARITPFLERAHLLDEVIAATRSPADDRYTVLWPHGTRAFSRT